ncbi:hypothetical protein P378_13345 [Desulforamulus profundi]|uniref:Uncharacterized protein n=1 Tax=Desulforamulus profundi TaxID=1383067 RepID=A0A2C6M6R9_9FIRM|nr:hypothetical protein [Desulforamulus profundi]PHJ37907.1 hypothetical protein P378_13345 [Desulforamulus profundi]
MEKEMHVCSLCEYHEEIWDQVDEGEIYEDGCFCKLNRNDLHFENCLEVNPKGCPHFKRK